MSTTNPRIKNQEFQGLDPVRLSVLPTSVPDPSADQESGTSGLRLGQTLNAAHKALPTLPQRAAAPEATGDRAAGVGEEASRTCCGFLRRRRKRNSATLFNLE